MNKVFFLVLAIISLEFVPASVLRARLTVRRNNLKAADAKANEVHDQENLDNAGALLESQARLSTLTKRFKQRQLPEQQKTVSHVDIESFDAASASKSSPVLDVSNEKAVVEVEAVSSQAQSLIQTSAESSESFQEDILRELIAQATKQLRAVKAQTLKVQRESQLKYMSELVDLIDDLEALVTGKRASFPDKINQTESAHEEQKRARDQLEIQSILTTLRPSLEKAEDQVKTHEELVNSDLIKTYRYIKDVVDSIREEIVDQLAMEIATNFPYLADVLGLFNETSFNNTSLRHPQKAPSFNSSTGVFVKPSVVTPLKVEVGEKKGKSLLKGELEKSNGAKVKTEVMTANDKKLRQQLSKSR